MNSKIATLLILLTILGGLYIRLFTDWFRPAPIQIVYLNRPKLSQNSSDLPVISFKFDRPYRLTRVKVISLSELATDKSPAALWRLDADSSSAPADYILYGLPVQGMKTTTDPSLLVPGNTYRLLIDAGRYHGEIDFQPAP